eukprot:3430299-Rhodomonas_salina.4
MATLAAAESEEEGQVAHAVIALALLYVPAAHGRQASDPCTTLKVPGAQAEHGPPSGPEKAGSQVQYAISVLPGSEPELTGQSVHAVAAVKLPY